MADGEPKNHGLGLEQTAPVTPIEEAQQSYGLQPAGSTHTGSMLGQWWKAEDRRRIYVAVTSDARETSWRRMLDLRICRNHFPCRKNKGG